MTGSPYVVEYSRTFGLEAPVEQVWDALERVDELQREWRWLDVTRRHGQGLAPAACLVCSIDPPVPYRLDIELTVQSSEPRREVVADVAGDLSGHGTLRLRAAGTGSTEVDVWWEVEMLQRRMRAAARITGPLMRWGHDRVVDTAIASFRRRLRA